MDTIAAKEFLISRVVDEATAERVKLSEIERKMLYFTEAHPSLPDIREVYDEFERKYDADDYEDKIAALLKHARERDQHLSDSREQNWKDALDVLKREDHYILVMVHQAFGAGTAANPGKGSRLRDFLIYIAIGVVFVLILLLASFWRSAH
jgi:hypothetical protein